MPNPILLSELRIGDTIAFHSVGELDGAIQYFSDSDYNHIASVSRIFPEVYVGQATASGYVETRLVDAIGDNTIWADVFRWRKMFADGHIEYLGDPNYPVLPVTQSVEKFIAGGAMYGYDKLFLLAPLMEVRRIENGEIWRKAVDNVGQKILDFVESVPIIKLIEDTLSHGQKPLICSEADYRIYDATPYKTQIVSADMYQLYQQTKITSDLLKQFDSARTAAGDPDANFIVPKDIAQSPDRGCIGRLKVA